MSSLPALRSDGNRPDLRIASAPAQDAREFPHFVPFEAALLGGVIFNASLLRGIAGVVQPGDFFRPDHQRLFALLLEMDSAGEPIDPLTVQERVARGGADRYGGLAYVIQLPDAVVSTANLDYYARRIRALSLARVVCRVADALSAGVREAGAAPEDLYAPLCRTLLDTLAQLGALAGGQDRDAVLTQLLRDWQANPAAVLPAWLGSREEAGAAFRAAYPRAHK